MTTASRSPRAGISRRRSAFARFAPLLGVAACGLVTVSCGMGDEPDRLVSKGPPPVASGGVVVSARQPLLPTYPCSRCHDGRPPDLRERALTEFHTQKVLNHGTQSGWCYRCHTKDDIDQLHLPDGSKVGFDQAYELCGGCHGDKLRDWKAGMHGLTTGWWLGARVRRSCPACHDPHDPKFPLMTPEHAPARPRTAPAEEPHAGGAHHAGEAHPAGETHHAGEAHPAGEEHRAPEESHGHGH